MNNKTLDIATLCCVFLLAAAWVITMRNPPCQEIDDDGDDKLNEVFAYDKNDKEIYRREAFILGGRRTKRAYIMVGIPTVYREFKGKGVFYLNESLSSFINPLTDVEKEDIQLLVVLADRDPAKREYVIKIITKMFSAEVESGLINIIGVLDRYYLQLENLISTKNDNKRIMYWRSKQTLDYTYMLNYAHNLCEYYIQSEDDTLINPDYMKIIKRDIDATNTKFDGSSPGEHLPWSAHKDIMESWLSLEYSKLGFAGYLFPSFYLSMISHRIKAFYSQHSIDYLYQGFPVSFKKARMQSLFTDIGKISSIKDAKRLV